jgi:hypothetical protein
MFRNFYVRSKILPLHTAELVDVHSLSCLEYQISLFLHPKRNIVPLVMSTGILHGTRLSFKIFDPALPFCSLNFLTARTLLNYRDPINWMQCY